MGGGDLNQKKSWHPNTMKNMERVWKAEQKDTEEKKRIAELQREIIAERDKEDMQKYAEDMGVVKKKDEVKLEWMYRGPSQSINREDYLLGKAVDKNFEKYNHEQTAGSSSAPHDEESLPDALRQAKSSMFSEQVDVARKLHEDPLMAIRQRAVEKAKQLYNNPVKMKQIQKMAAAKSLEDQKHGKEKKKKKKSKKSRKKDDDKMLDALLTQKLMSALKDRELLRKFKKKVHENSSGSSSESDSEDSDGSHRHERKSDTLRSSERGTVSKDNHTKEKSPSYSGNNRGREQTSHSYDEKNCRKHARSPKQYHLKRSYEQSPRRKSRSRSRERVKAYTNKEDTRHSSSRRGDDFRTSSSRLGTSTQFDNEKRQYKKQTSTFDDRKKIKPNIASSSDEDVKDKTRHGKVSSYDATSSSNAEGDSDDGACSRKKRTFGLMMADGSKPVVPKKSTVKDLKPQPAPEVQKPAPWQKREKVKLSEEEKEKRRKEMMENASWRDKERETNVKRYRMEEANEKRQLQENFDNDFAMKQFSKATNQTSVEGRIKSKLNTIQRSKMAMDHNFARR